MKYIAIPILCAFLSPGLSAAPQACGAHGDRNSMLVTTAWLAGHLQDPHLVVLGVGQRVDFDQAHIAGSQFLDLAEIRVMQPHNLELPPMPDLQKAFEKLGVADDSRIVLYALKTGNTTGATRSYLTLDAMGLGARAALLDGGLPAWQKESRPVSTEVRAVKAGKLTLCPQTDVIADLAFVKSNLRKKGVDIIDARNVEFYTGERIPNNQRAGHIPGAGNLTFSTLLDDNGKFHSPEVLREQFRKAGAQTGDRVVTYCHIGLQATMPYFVARYLGFDARLYDGSWEEWSEHTELPAEK